MLHHISVAVDHPHHVAQVIAEIFQGKHFPFPGHEGSYIVLAGDQYGTAIEVLPAGTELMPGMTEVEFVNAMLAPCYLSVHAALSVPTRQERIEAIAEREGWQVMTCDRGPFKVIEFWIENKFLLELLPPEMAVAYLNFMTIENAEAYVNQVASAY